MSSQQNQVLSEDLQFTDLTVAILTFDKGNSCTMKNQGWWIHTTSRPWWCIHCSGKQRHFLWDYSKMLISVL